MKVLKEMSSRVCPPGDGPRSVAHFGLLGVVARVSNSLWA